MRKIPTALVRNPADRAHVLMEIAPGTEWVFAGEGVPTRKFDGTCMMLDPDGQWWARREVKPGKAAPPNYVPEDRDETTGKTQGWEPIEQSAYVKQWQSVDPKPDEPGTYELIGPKVQGNPEHIAEHALIRHGAKVIEFWPKGLLTPDELWRQVHHVCFACDYEGIVWHHPDGRMAKLKLKDLK